MLHNLAVLLQPIDNELKIIDECQLRWIKFGFLCKCRQFPPKLPILFPDQRTAWNRCLARRWLQPVANAPDRLNWAFTVRFDVLTANVRDESLVPIRFAIHDQTTLFGRARTESFSAEENAQLQRHVETGQLIWLILHLCARNVVDAMITLSDQAIDILDPNFACIRQFQRASRYESARNNTKDDCFKKRLVLRIEWAVDEYASAGGHCHFGLTVSNN